MFDKKIEGNPENKVATMNSMLLFHSVQDSLHSSLLFSPKPSSHDAIRLVFSPPEESGCGVEPRLHPDGGFQPVITGAAAATKASTWHGVWFCLGEHVEVAGPGPALEPELATGQCKNKQRVGKWGKP